MKEVGPGIEIEGKDSDCTQHSHLPLAGTCHQLSPRGKKSLTASLRTGNGEARERGSKGGEKLWDPALGSCSGVQG